MTLSEFLKPALAVIAVVALGAGWYWFEHRSRPEEKETPSNALVIVTKSTNACFSDLVKVTGFIVPRREAVVGVDQEGSKVADVPGGRRRRRRPAPPAGDPRRRRCARQPQALSPR
jgi:multidrug efflux pump subunit AcrA (membrane-fusion protein)